jgi:hypothetical protein
MKSFLNRLPSTKALRLPQPPLFADDWLCARFLEIVCKHCGLSGDELDSHGIPAHADLMALCEEEGLIEITRESDGRIFGKVTSHGRALLDQLRAEREREAKP